MANCPPTRPLGAQISAMLADRGIDTVFGIPGVHNLELYRGLEQSGLHHVLARHEQGAGFMADGYARATGKPGVAFVITGPGLTNIMTPMGQAYSDSVPMLVISSCLDETAATRGQLHQMRDQRAAAETVCDWSQEARTPEAAYALIDRALVEFETLRPRPKHISVPIRRLKDSAGPFPPRQWRVHQRRNDEPDVAAALDLLNKARFPMIIAGGGAQWAGAQLMDLAEGLGAASFTTYAGRGLFYPGLTPLHFGSTLARASSADVLARADVLLAVGTELAEVDLWRNDLGFTGKVIRVDLDSEVLAADPRADVAILGDAQAVLEALFEHLDLCHEPRWSAQEVAVARARWRAQVDTERPGIVPICDVLRDCLPDATVVFSDMTQFAYVAKEVWDMPVPGHWHHPSGFGTLGYALPAAIGGKVGVGDQPVIAVAGDYGFQYTLPELGTAAELDLSLPILLWDNGNLKEIEASMAAAQIAPVAIKAKNPDFSVLADAYGIGYAKPESLASLQDDVRASLQADGPTLIHMTPALTGR